MKKLLFIVSLFLMCETPLKAIRLGNALETPTRFHISVRLSNRSDDLAIFDETTEVVPVNGTVEVSLLKIKDDISGDKDNEDSKEAPSKSKKYTANTVLFCVVTAFSETSTSSKKKLASCKDIFRGVKNASFDGLNAIKLTVRKGHNNFLIE